MANHPLQSSGTIKMSDINLEFGRSSTAQISLHAAETNGGYGAINAASTSKPNGSNPNAMSEWYGYNHNAVAYIPVSFASMNTYNTDSSFPTTYGIYPSSYAYLYLIKNNTWNYTHTYSRTGMSYGLNYYDSFSTSITDVTQLMVGDNINFYYQIGNNYNQGYFTMDFVLYINGSSYSTSGFGGYNILSNYAFNFSTGFTIPSGTTSIGFNFTATAYGAPVMSGDV